MSSHEWGVCFDLVYSKLPLMTEVLRPAAFTDAQSRQLILSRSLNCSAAALTYCNAAPMLASSFRSMLALPCSGLRYSVVWLAWLVALPTAASNSGRLVMASMRPVGCAALQYQLHQL